MRRDEITIVNLKQTSGIKSDIHFKYMKKEVGMKHNTIFMNNSTGPNTTLINFWPWFQPLHFLKGPYPDMRVGTKANRLQGLVSGESNYWSVHIKHYVENMKIIERRQDIN